MAEADNGKPTPEDLQALRREAGEELQALRRAQGLSQRDLAKLLDIHQLTFVSQFETGRRRPPADKYVVYAQALNIDPKDFVERMMRYYDPVMHSILFENQEIASAIAIEE